MIQKLMRFTIYCLFVVFISCHNKIETDSTLNEKDKKFIYSLGLLDKDEKILKFYSEFKNQVAGNFFTDRRIAKYWIDENDKSKDQINSAYYRNIAKIDTIYYAGATYCPYMEVTKIDGFSFKVCVDGKPNEIKAFFEQALDIWTKEKNHH
jgi:hypothetical protein